MGKAEAKLVFLAVAEPLRSFVNKLLLGLKLSRAMAQVPQVFLHYWFVRY
jgi:hypothetical protein